MHISWGGLGSVFVVSLAVGVVVVLFSLGIVAMEKRTAAFERHTSLLGPTVTAACACPLRSLPHHRRLTRLVGSQQLDELHQHPGLDQDRCAYRDEDRERPPFAQMWRPRRGDAAWRSFQVFRTTPGPAAGPPGVRCFGRTGPLQVVREQPAQRLVEAHPPVFVTGCDRVVGVVQELRKLIGIHFEGGLP